MIYLYIGKDQIKVLYLKKTILGQHETLFFAKKHEIILIDNGKVVNIDLLASAIKEALTLISATGINKKEVYLILPQEVFYFFRTDIPKDIASSALTSFVYDKARATINGEIDNCISDYFILEGNQYKILNFFAIDKGKLDSYKQALNLLDLKIVSILPDTLAYFKLFDKTLRHEKKENIFYVYFDKNNLEGYLFDSYGLISNEKWISKLTEKAKIESNLKDKAKELENKNFKLNRIILSGPDSENIRQDTFTKAVGVWTNPLKRIIPNFYQDYLKMIIVDQNKKFPILNYDVCFGAFIFCQENKKFSLMRNGSLNIKKTSNFNLPKIHLPKKEFLIFIFSFILSFLFFLLIFRVKVNFGSISSIFRSTKPIIAKVTPSPAPPTLTPTPAIKKEIIKIKILNGSGVSGKANELKEILINKGYQEILTGNADNFDYLISELSAKKSASAAAAQIKSDLKEQFPNLKQNALEESETADIIITFGADFK